RPRGGASPVGRREPAHRSALHPDGDRAHGGRVAPERESDPALVRGGGIHRDQRPHGAAAACGSAPAPRRRLAGPKKVEGGRRPPSNRAPATPSRAGGRRAGYGVSSWPATSSSSARAIG